jgi:hypothetical protein
MINRREAIKTASVTAFGAMLPVNLLASENKDDPASFQLDGKELPKLEHTPRQRLYQERRDIWRDDHFIINSLASYLMSCPKDNWRDRPFEVLFKDYKEMHNEDDEAVFLTCLHNGRTDLVYRLSEKSPRTNWYWSNEHHSHMLAQLMAMGDLFLKYEYHERHDTNYFQCYDPKNVFKVVNIEGETVQYQTGSELSMFKCLFPIDKNDLSSPKPNERDETRSVHPDNIVHMRLVDNGLPKLYPDQYGRSPIGKGFISNIKNRCKKEYDLELSNEYPSAYKQSKKIPWRDILSKDVFLSRVVLRIAETYIEGYKQQIRREMDFRGLNPEDFDILTNIKYKIPEWKEIKDNIS